jgi:hypothetical protein
LTGFLVEMIVICAMAGAGGAVSPTPIACFSTP